MPDRTNEDALKDMLRDTPKTEVLRLQPTRENPFIIDVYRYPVLLTGWEYLSQEAKDVFRIGSLMAIEFHPERWL